MRANSEVIFFDAHILDYTPEPSIEAEIFLERVQQKGSHERASCKREDIVRITVSRGTSANIEYVCLIVHFIVKQRRLKTLIHEIRAT